MNKLLTVFVPTMLLTLTGGVKLVEMEADNVRQVIDHLETLYPGMRDRLVESGQIRSNLAVAVDGEVARMGHFEKIGGAREIHFVPAIGGGS